MTISVFLFGKMGKWNGIGILVFWMLGKKMLWELGTALNEDILTIFTLYSHQGEKKQLNPFKKGPKLLFFSRQTWIRWLLFDNFCHFYNEGKATSPSPVAGEGVGANVEGVRQAVYWRVIWYLKSWSSCAVAMCRSNRVGSCVWRAHPINIRLGCISPQHTSLSLWQSQLIHDNGKIH